MKPTEVPLLQLLYDALHSPLGVEVATTDPERLRAKLYPLRKSDDIFLPLAFIISPFNLNNLWIVRKDSTDEY